MVKTFTGNWVIFVLLIILCWPAAIIYFVIKYEEQPMYPAYGPPPAYAGAPPPGYAPPPPGYAPPPPQQQYAPPPQQQYVPPQQPPQQY